MFNVRIGLLAEGGNHGKRRLKAQVALRGKEKEAEEAQGTDGKTGCREEEVEEGRGSRSGVRAYAQAVQEDDRECGGSAREVSPLQLPRVCGPVQDRRRGSVSELSQGLRDRS